MSDNELDDELLALADDMDDEGDASAPGSPESLGSVAMEESDSDADGEAEDDDEGNPFPLEGKFRNEKDRAEIMAMTEVQREELLAERAAEQERRLQDLQLRKLLAQREKDEEVAKKKRKAGAAELDDSQRKSSRQKTKQSETLDNYRKAREARGKELERQRQRGRMGSLSASPGHGSGSDRDAEGEDEVDWDFGARPSAAVKDDPPADLKDFNSVRIGRAGFSEVCFYPGFEDAITGTYCRMNAGPKEPGSDEYLYRMMLIKGFVELPDKPYGPYVLEWNGKRYMTDQYVIGVEGKAEKKIQFNHCSNSRITESEFEYYKNAIQSASMRMPKRSELEAKFRDIHHLRNMKFSSDDIQYKLSKQNKYAGRLAQSAVNSIPKPKTSAQIMQERLEEINRANRRRNQEEGRKAMIAERKKEMQRRAQAAKERERKEKEAADKAARDAERRAHLAVLGKDELFDGSDISRSATPGISRAGTPLPKREVKGIPTFTKKKMEDDVIASLDLDIDIEI